MSINLKYVALNCSQIN